MKLFIVLFAFVLCASGSVTPKFPRCKKSDPYLNKCLIDGIETMRPMLKVGMADVGIPAVDPFVLTPFEINRKDNNIKFKGTIQGMGYGGGAFIIENLAVSLKDKQEMDLSLTIPTLDITADYMINELNILLLSFEGKGKFTGKFTDVKAHVKVVSTPIFKNGVEYAKLENLSVKVKIGGGNISLKDERSPFLAMTMASFFNAGPSTILNILAPGIDEATTDVVKDILEKAFDNIPTSEIIINS